MLIKKNLKKYIFNENHNIYDLIKFINKNALGFAIILDNHKNVSRVLTDGDIRRILIKKIDLNTKISSLKKKKFKFLYYDVYDIESVAINSREFKNCFQIPIIDKNKKLKAIFIKNKVKVNFYEDNESKSSVFVLAGGKGKRMGSLTKKIPKPMLKIGNKMILENIISSFYKYGFKNFIFSVNYLSKKIVNKFQDGKNYNVNIKYVKEKKFLGTAGSLSLINKKKISENFYITNGDVFANLDYLSILKNHRLKKNDLTILARLHFYDLPYGLINNSKNIVLNEKPKITYFVNSGIYIMNKRILNILPKNKYLNMNDLLNFLKEKKFKVGVHTLLDDIYDIGDKKKYFNILNKVKDKIND